MLAAGTAGIAAPGAAAAGSPVERASATGVEILTPAGHHRAGSPTVFAWEAPVSRRGYRFPEDGAVVQVDRVSATAERTTGAAMAADGAVVLRAVESFGGRLEIDVIRARASLGVTADGLSDLSGTRIVGMRLDGSPVDLAPGKKLWVKGWGYAVVDPPLVRTDDTAAGDTRAALRLHLTSVHAGLPAGTDILLGGVHADLEGVPAAESPAGVGGGDGGAAGTLPDRQGELPHMHSNPPSRPRSGGTGRPAVQDGAASQPQHRHRQRRPVPVTHPDAPPLRGLSGDGARAAVVRAALAEVGWPYVWGGESRIEGGFDCSGLVDYAYAKAGYALPGRPTAAVLWAMSVPITPADLRPGDLVFLGARSAMVHHVALYAGGGWVIAAPHRGAPVAVQPLDSAPWDGYGRILQAPNGRVLSAGLLAARKRPAVRRTTAEPQRERRAAAPVGLSGGVSPAPPQVSAPGSGKRGGAPVPRRRRNGQDKLAALPREDFRRWAVKLLVSFRGGGR